MGMNHETNYIYTNCSESISYSRYFPLVSGVLEFYPSKETAFGGDDSFFGPLPRDFARSTNAT